MVAVLVLVHLYRRVFLVLCLFLNAFLFPLCTSLGWFFPTYTNKDYLVGEFTMQ